MTSSIQCHSNLILVPYHKPFDTMMDIYDVKNFYLKTKVVIWMGMNLISV